MQILFRWDDESPTLLLPTFISQNYGFAGRYEDVGEVGFPYVRRRSFAGVGVFKGPLMVNVVTREHAVRRPVIRSTTDGSGWTGAAPGGPAQAQSAENGQDHEETVSLDDILEGKGAYFTSQGFWQPRRGSWRSTKVNIFKVVFTATSLDLIRLRRQLTAGSHILMDESGVKLHAYISSSLCESKM
ncbi:unnamed protein product [Bursaphelenchus xylophilus]|uniref:(pine wood nematode) hypothetical protein n=1 Tax=Bursaphelenchus xylophilus TaxID=6326 RepID=A0A1I7SR82_BURXY|nr:unnamed protein product [Bursaphelenchus xylophilus]CAG9110960.1 unnamed protein product [Bursaphelenchus xylophilus]